MKEELKKYAESLKVKLEENEVEKFGRVLNEEQRRLIRDMNIRLMKRKTGYWLITGRVTFLYQKWRVKKL